MVATAKLIEVKMVATALKMVATATAKLIERERDRERERCIYVYMYICLIMMIIVIITIIINCIEIYGRRKLFCIEYRVPRCIAISILGAL